MIKLTLSSEELFKIKQMTINGCTICHGSGHDFVYEHNVKVPINCECVKKYSLYRRYKEAGIGRLYWDFDPNNMDEEFLSANEEAYGQLQAHFYNMESFIEDRKSLFIYGPNGLGKTAMGTYMIKQALAIMHPNDVIDYKYTCGVFTLPEISSLLIQAITKDDMKDILKKIDTLDLIFIDEFDKEYKVRDKTNYFGLEFGEFFNNLYSSQKPIIIAANLSLQEIASSGIHTKDVIDRVSHFKETVVLKGISFRQRLERLQENDAD